MARYGEAFRNRVVARLLPPESANIGIVDLKEFVAETLQQIVEGIKTAQISTQQLGAAINPNLLGDYTVHAKHGFSSGLDPRLVSAVDRFVFLDDFYFEPIAPDEAAQTALTPNQQ